VRALQGNPQNDYGGIDFNPKNINIETKGDGQVAIKFHLDGALLWKFQNARGFVPVIMNISSLKSLEDFLVKR